MDPEKEREILAITTRTGGTYIPPARLRAMQAQIQDKSGEAFQRMSWEALKKSINGLINKVRLFCLFCLRSYFVDLPTSTIAPVGCYDVI